MIINLSSEEINEKELTWWLEQVMLELGQRKVQPKFLPMNQENDVYKWDVNLVFVLEQKMQELNRTFRNQDCVTDILSFSSKSMATFNCKRDMQDSDIYAKNRSEISPTIRERFLGELVLCLPFIRRKATELDFSHWLYYLIVHGVLHLFGFQHESSDRESMQMYRIQDEVFEKLSSGIKE